MRVSVSASAFFRALAAAVLSPALLSAGTHQSVPESPGSRPGPVFRVESVGFRSGYDSNVHLQRHDREGAWVNSLHGRASLAWSGGPLWEMLAGYAVEAVAYDGHSSENHIIHRASLDFSGDSGDTSWELLNSTMWIDGDSEGPLFDSMAIPGIGGVPLRDRRDATVLRSGFKLTRHIGRWFLRPTASVYHHDFHTRQRPADFLSGSVYENYVDRREAGAGLELGYEVADKLWLVAAARVGRQRQGTLLGAASPYGNKHLRLLAGVEGAPLPWLKLNILAGPDWRDWRHGTPAGLDRSKDHLHLNASLSISPTESDVITLGAVRFLQPAFASQSMYEDVSYEITWRHSFGDAFSATAGFKAYGAEWLRPARCRDWIFTPSASLSYRHDEHLGIDLSYLCDRADCRVPGSGLREYTRHLVWLGLKHTF